MTKVVFRKHRDGSVFALLPQEPASPAYPEFCVSYYRAGRKDGTFCRLALAHSKPALPREYEPLLPDLEATYPEFAPFTVAQRVTKRDHELRKQKLQEYLAEGV